MKVSLQSGSSFETDIGRATSDGVTPVCSKVPSITVGNSLRSSYK
jgi:hypothetical protein